MEIVKPAQLDFLAIYSPALGPTDETLPDQLVYYYTGDKRDQKRDNANVSAEQRQKDVQNEQLRNVGLAQGMVSFGKAFSDGDNVDFIDSEKSRIFMHELEPGWWILASVNLTQLRITTTSKGPKGKLETKVKLEYSGREVSPHSLLLQQVLSAHSVFLLHHGPALAEMYTRLKRTKFCAALDRFWSPFCKKWEVLLHGTPAVDIFPGIKLSAGGELGIGVGEEDWGSGEREVLEDFTRRTDGLLDVVVSRFGDAQPDTKDSTLQPWIGNGSLPTASDGVIYSGISRISKKSVATISKWMERIYKSGLSAYGVQDNPHTSQRRKKRNVSSKPQTQGLDAWPTGIPPPLITAADKSLELATAKVENQKHKGQSEAESASSNAGTDVLMKYMTFGLYGSGWGLPISKVLDQASQKSSKEDTSMSSSDKAKQDKPKASRDAATSVADAHVSDAQAKPYFLIGLQGSLDAIDQADSENDGDSQSDAAEAASWNSRILLRTLYVQRIQSSSDESNDTAEEAAIPSSAERVQVIVYINQPFVFTFIFELNTPTLSVTSFYKSIHHQLGPLQKPLLRSTAPETIHSRLSEVASPRTTSAVDNKQPIYDLIYDPINFTIHTTIPPIPDAGNLNAQWSRLDALNVHSQIISTKHATEQYRSEIERTAKISRGWWVVWMKFTQGAHKHSKEAFLVRKATDYVEEGSRKGSFGFGKDMTSWGSSAGKVAEGIGIDARRYVEGLISLSR